MMWEGIAATVNRIEHVGCQDTRLRSVDRPGLNSSWTPALAAPRNDRKRSARSGLLWKEPARLLHDSRQS